MLKCRGGANKKVSQQDCIIVWLFGFYLIIKLCYNLFIKKHIIKKTNGAGTPKVLQLNQTGRSAQSSFRKVTFSLVGAGYFFALFAAITSKIVSTIIIISKSVMRSPPLWKE